MKYLFLFCIIAFGPAIAYAQDTINPYNTQQSSTIELHGKINVYYNPYFPPASTDTSWVLSSLSAILTDSDGIYTGWPGYNPRTHGVNLKDTLPMGIGAGWQRFFTARDKQDQSLLNRHSDIVAGGLPGDSVIISKNEDVDFRATGTIKLKSGFRAMAGCKFHAYIEPKWDTTVFSDDFKTFDRGKWYVANGSGDQYGTASNCSSDTNVVDTMDIETWDGHALDIFMREYSDTFTCRKMDYEAYDTCHGRPANPPSTTQNLFTSAIVRACPWPYKQKDSLPLVPAYQHAPYGKYEIREKIPHLIHHTNNWLGGGPEIDINETTGPPAGPYFLFPTIHEGLRYGPFKGVFHKSGTIEHTGYALIDSVIFVSHDADWSGVNQPHGLLINNFSYEVSEDWGHGSDSTKLDPRGTGWMGWPASLANDTTDSVTFYYSRYPGNQADSLTWTVRQATDSSWRIFSAPYHVNRLGDTLRFSKAYQPTSVTLTVDTSIPGNPVTKSFNCHWEYNLNPPYGTGDSGILYLDQPLDTSGIHSNMERYSYNISEEENANPGTPFDLSDTAGGYKYHTFGVEVLPHELRYLIDSNVVLRLPDRMIPKGSPGWDFDIEHSPLDLLIGEFDLFGGDPFSLDTTSVNYIERKYFENHPYNPGFRDVNIGGIIYHAAHHLIDYVRIWDIPKDVKVPNFPN